MRVSTAADTDAPPPPLAPPPRVGSSWTGRERDWEQAWDMASIKVEGLGWGGAMLSLSSLHMKWEEERERKDLENDRVLRARALG